MLQVKYKEGKTDLSTNLYSLLPETEEIKFAKAVMELQSEVRSGVSSFLFLLFCPKHEKAKGNNWTISFLLVFYNKFESSSVLCLSE